MKQSKGAGNERGLGVHKVGKNGVGEGDIWTETGRSTSVSQERRVGRTCHTEGPASEGIRSEGAEELLTTSSKSWSLGPSLRFWFSRSGRNPDTSIFMFLKKIQYRENLVLRFPHGLGPRLFSMNLLYAFIKPRRLSGLIPTRATKSQPPEHGRSSQHLPTHPCSLRQ